jgi:uncharacterized protein DUF4386
MSTLKRAAHRAGALYFLFMIVAIVGEFFFPAFVVPDDAGATARNIISAESAYRVSILMGFITLVIFIFLVVSLHRLLRDVDESQAMRMVLLVSIGIAVSLANLLEKFMPLVLLSGADYLSAFTRPQLEALALSFLRWHSSGATLSTAFWGLWLFPFGILVMRSRFVPWIFGLLLMVAGTAYLVSSVTAVVLPALRHVVSQLMMPLYLGEVPIIFWLLIRGVRVPDTTLNA